MLTEEKLELNHLKKAFRELLKKFNESQQQISELAEKLNESKDEINELKGQIGELEIWKQTYDAMLDKDVLVETCLKTSAAQKVYWDGVEKQKIQRKNLELHLKVLPRIAKIGDEYIRIRSIAFQSGISMSNISKDFWNNLRIGKLYCFNYKYWIPIATSTRAQIKTLIESNEELKELCYSTPDLNAMGEFQRQLYQDSCEITPKLIREIILECTAMPRLTDNYKKFLKILDEILLFTESTNIA